MLLSCWIAALLLLPAGTRPQSGDGDEDEDGEPTLRCTSHLLRAGSSLICKLVGGRSDDEDDEGGEGDGVRNMTACFKDFNLNQDKCLEAAGDTVTKLHPLFNVTVTVHLKTGGRITTTVDLKKIVRPKSPQVKNVTFDQEAQRAVIRFQTPYFNDYLKVDNQLFQLHVWTAGSTITQNVSADTSLEIGMERLLQPAEYHVRVRAIPEHGLQGSWSGWSKTFTFFTPADVQKETDERRETNKLIVCLVILLVVPSSVVFFCKNKIFTYMWPSIPHPKHTLVQICKTHKGLLLNFKPEEFSTLKVEKTEEPEPQITAEAAGSAHSTPSCSAQSTPCCSAQSTTSCSAQSTTSCSAHSSEGSGSSTSVSTEISALLSRSSSDGEDGLQSSGPTRSLGGSAHTPRPEGSGGGNEAEAYVTMSSFYQIQ